jgi:sugar phosphate isomerase/epimerase
MDIDIGIAGWALNGEILREKTLTLLEFPAVCREFGVRTVELVSSFFASQHAKYLNELRRALEDNGLSVRNIAVDMGNIAGPDPKERRTDLEALKQWFYVASAIGSQAIRINTGHPNPGGGWVPTEPVPQEALDRVVEGYRELVEVGRQAGVKLLIENHGGISADPKNIAYILEQLDTEWFGTCPDTANFPIPDTWEEGMRIMAPRAFSCHVKVFSYDPSGRQRRIGRDGRVIEYDLKRALQILKDAGYQGPLCIESGASATERDSIRDAIPYVRALWQSLS